MIDTGPFVFDSLTVDIEMRMHRWDNYWRDKAFFKELVFTFIDDAIARSQAMLAGDVDFIQGADPNSFSTFEADPDIDLVEFGADFMYYFFGFNNKLLDTTWRKAISYAYDYDYMISEIWLDSVVHGCPAIPEGMLGHNASVQDNLPEFDIPYARSIMQSMGFSVGWNTAYPGTDEGKWTSAKFATQGLGAPLKLNLYSGSVINRQMNDLAFLDFQLIGIDTTEEELENSDFYNYYINDPDHLQL